MFNFTDQVIIVTGAGRGLGRAYTLALAARGAQVVAIDNGCDVNGAGRDPSVLEHLDDTVHDMGEKLVSYCEDVTDYEVMARIVDEVHTKFGRIDGLICNAGLMLVQQDEMDNLDLYRRQMETNYFASIALVQKILPLMKAAQRGNIVMTGGLTPAYGDKRLTGFAAAAAAIVGAVRCLAVDLEETGVNINVLIPANFSRQSEQLDMPYNFETMTPDMVAPAMLYLLSGQAPNGQMLSAGGGYYSLLEVVERDGFMLDPSMQRPQVLAQSLQRVIGAQQGRRFKTFIERMSYVLKLLMEKRT